MSDGIAAYHCERAGPQHAQGLLGLFESAGSGCYCNYWHFEGDKNAWLERCYLRPEENRSALVARLEGPELCGVVAVGQARVCGWMKLSRATSVPRIYAQKPYRNLPLLAAGAGTERETVYAVGCTYVADADRGRGVGRALLRAAIRAVQQAGGSALEAFPRGTPDGEKLREDEVWMGPEALYLTAGFARVSDFRPYPLLRLQPLPPE
jgi:ribosomal protein S18 acetylase RimI-like enzyme